MRKKELQKEISGLKLRIDFMDEVLSFCTERIEAIENHIKQEEKAKNEVVKNA